MKQAHRFNFPATEDPVGGVFKPAGPYNGLTELGKHGPRWTGRARFVPEMLDAPLRWKKPRRVFVNSMSDLFHEDITNEQIATVFAVMASCQQHTFQILTKRPERMLAWFEWADEFTVVPCSHASPLSSDFKLEGTESVYWDHRRGSGLCLDNVWLGVSAEDQQRADERIPLLLRCPAAVRFVSAEPLIGPVDFEHIGNALFDRELAIRKAMRGPSALNREQAESSIAQPQLSWVIVGGESGPGARPCDVEWIRSIVRQCRDAGVPAFVKQLGSRPAWTIEPGLTIDLALVLAKAGEPLRDRKGGDIAEFPDDLRIRQFPEAQP